MELANRQGDIDAGILSIQINTLNVLVSSMALQCARLADQPVTWLHDLETLALAAADGAPFLKAGSVGPDMMRAAVLASLEEIITRLKSVADTTGPLAPF